MISEEGRKSLSESTKLQHKRGNLTALSHSIEASRKRSESLHRYHQSQGHILRTKKCIVCSNTYVKSWNVGAESWKRSRFCSRDCFHNYRSKHPESCSTLFKKGHDGYHTKAWLGKKFTKEHRENISKALSNSKKFKESMKELGKQRMGPNHPRWKGGISGEYYYLRNNDQYKKWRIDVYKRDHYHCQICGNGGQNIVAHHIKTFNNYPELRYEISNGITLCRACHKVIHTNNGDIRLNSKMYERIIEVVSQPPQLTWYTKVV